VKFVACVSVNCQTPFVPNVFVATGCQLPGKMRFVVVFQNVGVAGRAAQTQNHVAIARHDTGDERRGVRRQHGRDENGLEIGAAPPSVMVPVNWSATLLELK